MSNKFKIISACILAGVLIFCVAVVIVGQRNASAATQHARMVLHARRNFANRLVQMQIMTPDETVRLQSITDNVLESHAISDADLDWMLALLNQPEFKPGNEKLLHDYDLGTLENVKNTTPQQRDKVFAALLPLLSSPEMLDKFNADCTLVAFKVTKAIPYIQPQMQDPNPSVRKFAKHALTKLAS